MKSFSNCPLCGEQGLQALLNVAKCDVSSDLVQCQTCCLVFLNPQPTRDQLRIFYSQNYWIGDQIHNNEKERLINALFKFLLRSFLRARRKVKWRWLLDKPLGNMLDAGCGDGLILSELLSSCTMGIGLDLYTNLHKAKQLNPRGLFIAGDICDLPFFESQFDFAVLHHVLEHVDDPVRAVTELRRVLRPGGRLFIEVPNIRSLQARFFGSRWHQLDFPRHLFLFGPDSLSFLLARFGFAVERRKRFSIVTDPSAFVLSLFPAWAPQAVRAEKKAALLTLLKSTVYLGCQLLALPITALMAWLSEGATVSVLCHLEK